jgi:WS/DGAT/MGAT family acyltransferase
MEQLTGQDASFLYSETPNAPLHVASLAIYDQTQVSGGYLRFTDILASNAERIHLSGTMRRKVVRVPMDLDHPYWVEDKTFDLEYHIRHISLPAPGDWRQLYILAARIMARGLDMSKPPWEMYYIEGLDNLDGLPDNCFAVIAKTHHCAIDGASTVALAELMHDFTPEPQVIPPPETPWRGEDEPQPLELMARTFGNNITKPLQMAEALTQSIPAARKFWQAISESPPQRLAPVPKTRFNRVITGHRVIGFRRFSLDEVRAWRKRVEGATVNDAMVAVCGGALRRYLDAKQELPTDSLVAMAPINVRTETEQGSFGNKVSAMLISVGSHIEDPLERLQHVHASSSQSKALSNAVGARQMTDAMQFIPGSLVVMGTRYASQMGLANQQNPTFNVTITNVPGPQVPLYSMGAELLTMLGYAPLTDGVGLMFPIGSYNGEIIVSFTACREMLPDPEFMEECIQEAYEEMHTLLDSEKSEAGS